MIPPHYFMQCSGGVQPPLHSLSTFLLRTYTLSSVYTVHQDSKPLMGSKDGSVNLGSAVLQSR